MALLRPPLNEFDQLTRPLNESEQAVAEALGKLDDGWTVYVQPKVALDQPDFIAVHDLLGVCVIEVRDWAPDAARPAHDDPRFIAARTRSVVYDQFFALPSDGTEVTEVVRAAVVLPRCTQAEATNFLGTSDAEGAERNVEVWGSEALHDRLDRIVQGTGCAHPQPESTERARTHIVPSEVAQAVSLPAPRSAGAFQIEVNEQGQAIRRVRGAAGSGKSFGLAARAAHLAAQGKQVLVLSFNVTLSNHLRSMSVERCAEYRTNPTRITCTNFHSLCTRIVQDAARVGIEPTAPRGLRWTSAIVKKAEDVLLSGTVPRYDAVLVDEGQDYEAAWWNLLRDHLLAPGGEMLFVADPTQDLYGRIAWHTEEEMAAAGFDSPWLDLGGSYRLPADLAPAMADFAAHRIGSNRVLATTVPDDLIDVAGPSHGSLRLWNTVGRVGDLGVAVGREVVRLLQRHPLLRPGDVAFVCEYHHDGVAAVRVIEAAGYPVHHIFSRDPDDARRRRKYRFSPSVDAVKGSTIHNLKGWQSTVLVIGIGLESKSKKMGYVAMTRLRNHPTRPAVLSVVSADRHLEEFGASFAGMPIRPAGTTDAPSADRTPVAPSPAPVTPLAAPAPVPMPTPSGTKVDDRPDLAPDHAPDQPHMVPNAPLRPLVAPAPMPPMHSTASPTLAAPSLAAPRAAPSMPAPSLAAPTAAAAAPSSAVPPTPPAAAAAPTAAAFAPPTLAPPVAAAWAAPAPPTPAAQEG